MQTLEQFEDRIKTVADIKSVVATMKTLAAVRIRQFEAVANATDRHNETIEKAMQLLLQQAECPSGLLTNSQSRGRCGVVLLGTDQGFCGRFNESVVEKLVENFVENARDIRIIAAGTKLVPFLRPNLKPSRFQLDHIFSLPCTIDGINSLADQILQELDSWQSSEQVDSIHLVFSRRSRSSINCVVQQQLLPMSPEFLKRLSTRPWHSRSRPSCSVDWSRAFSCIVQQWLFVQVFRCIAESLASENAGRISAMQNAQRNIEDRLSKMNLEFNQLRQRSITEELRDILVGFEAS